MSSYMLSGDRRWASARRGGMTVLGKVAVPKPLNLPSQRHENHGLDPNVEIVPKSTLSWGSRPSSSGSSPWVSVASSNADGGAGSPGHPSVRPSSSGSGTRPSTSGSDKPHETLTNTTSISTSRPSSSSGTSSSIHTPSTPLHPRSSENRHTSSHLSRFAEPVSQHPMAWGPSMAAEKMGVKSTKDGCFSLSSGDFPNLGSEKDNLTKNNECQGYSRPRSASGRIGQTNKEKADVKSDSVTIWSADGSPSFEDEKHLASGKLHGDPPQYLNVKASHQPFDTWHGPPMNRPAGIWYGGHTRGPAVRIPNTPGGFPVDAFPYYHYQMSHPALAGSQAPPPGSGSRGPHPKGGDIFRPQMPDSFASPNMPFRPGFYPGLPRPMVFEGYYRPPMGYCNNERDAQPFIGISAGHPVYNGFGGPGVDTGVPHGRPAAGVPFAEASSEQVEAGHPMHNQAPKRPPENPDDCNQKDEVPNSGKKFPIIYSRKNEWGAEQETEEVAFAKSETSNDTTSVDHQYAVHSAESEMKNFHGGATYVKTVTDYKSASGSEGGLFISQGMVQLPQTSERNSPYAPGARNSPLIQKIGCLNAKVRLSDGQNDPASPHFQEHERNEPPFAERSSVSRDGSLVANVVKAPGGHRPQPTAVLSRKPYKSRQDGDHRVDNDQRRRPLSSESWAAGSARKVGSVPIANTHMVDASYEDGWTSVMNQPRKNEEDVVEPHVSSDILEQRTKMRELAKMRAVQLQKEEEERTREQKAKALAKLEELNRRTFSSDSAGQKAEPMLAMRDNQTSGEAQECGESAAADTNFLDFGKDKILIQDGTAVNPSCSEKQDGHAGYSKQEAYESDDVGITSHPGMKQIGSNPFLKNMTVKFGTIVSDAENDGRDPASEDVLAHDNLGSESKLATADTAKTSKHVSVSSAHQRKRNNRNIKYKHKLNDTPVAEATPTMDSGEASTEIAESNSFESHVLSSGKPDKDGILQEESSSVPSEESDRKASVQWKPPSRRFQRSQQGNRFADKVHSNDSVKWAPVRSQTKAEANVESNKKPAEVSASSTKDDSTSQNPPKGKRAEVERYVLKPVALELAQQSGTQHLSTISSLKSVEGTRKVQSSIASSGSVPLACSASMHVGSGLNTNEGDVRPVKLKKGSGTWRQRVDSSETKVPVPSSQNGIQQSKEPSRSAKNDLQPLDHEIKTSSGAVSSDDNDLLSSAAPAMNRNQSAKAQGLSNRGRRQSNRGSRSTGSHYDPEFTSGNSLQHSAPDGNQADRGNFSRENRNFGEKISSHWQPKTHANPSDEQNRAQDPRGESAADVNKHSRKSHNQQNKVHEAIRHSRIGQSLQEHGNVKRDTTESSAGELRDFEQQKRRLPENAQVHSTSENREPATNSSKDGHQFEGNFYSGTGGNARKNNRFSRIHDSRGGAWPSAHDNWHNGTAQEKPRQIVHPEYQPVVNKSETIDEQVVVSNSSHRQGPRKGHSQTTRRVGNYYRRHSSSTSADVGATG